MAGTVITVGDSGSYYFGAAHCGLHGGQLERLHGHTFVLRLTLHGDLDADAMVCDFTAVKDALAAAIAPLRRRTLMPAAWCRPENGQVIVECGGKRYSFPAGDVVMLPLANTTTEAIAGYLLGHVMPYLAGTPVQRAELTLAESPDALATAAAGLAAAPVSARPGRG